MTEASRSSNHSSSNHAGSSPPSSSPPSSSPRSGRIDDGVIRQHSRPVGPLRLPSNRSGDFVAEFNRVYRGIGLVLSPVAREEDEKIPGNAEVARDSDLDQEHK